MKHKLLLINLLLIVLVAASGSVLRTKWREAKAREELVLKQRAAAVPPPVITPIPAVPPVPSANYVDVAMKLITSKDRNPTVVIEPPPPVPVKVMPPLPFQYGVMDFGAGPTVMLAEKSGGAQHGYRIGEKIGSFKLLDVNRTDILFDWDGKPVQKKLSELVDKNANAAAEKAASEAPKTAAAASAPAAPPPPAEPRPGKSMGAEAKACQPGDGSPAGTVADGFKKGSNRKSLRPGVPVGASAMTFDLKGDSMKNFLLVLAAALPLLCSAQPAAAQKKTTKTTAASAKKAAPAPKPITIPADAVKTGDNTYSKTDAQGKTWIYTKTPFGITKAEQTSDAQKQAAAVAPPPPGLTATEEGDNIRFAKPSPFGTQTWTRNKSELTDDERAVWERQKQSAAKREQ